MFARVASAGQRAARQDRGPGVRSVNIITSYTAASSTIHARYRGGSTSPRHERTCIMALLSVKLSAFPQKHPWLANRRHSNLDWSSKTQGAWYLIELNPRLVSSASASEQ